MSRYIGAPPGPRRMDGPLPAHHMYRAERSRYALTVTTVSGRRVSAVPVARRGTSEHRLAFPFLLLPLLAMALAAGAHLLPRRTAGLDVASQRTAAVTVLGAAIAAPDDGGSAETSPGRDLLATSVASVARLFVLARELPLEVAASAGVAWSHLASLAPAPPPKLVWRPVLQPVVPLIHPSAIELVRLAAPGLPPLPATANLQPVSAVPRPAYCLAETPAVPEATPPSPPASHDPAVFGVALAVAARQQVSGFVIYNPRYQRLSYPMGDVPSLFGVCSDVVIRAYRALGIDLQELVMQTRVGRDPNIDHRRVETLRLFFARHGQSLPVTDMAEDYLPGDIVVYHRPQNRTTTTHIAIVSDVLAPSGRLMIIHNRGWGPQLEDALLVDRITGHFRFSGMPPKPPAVPSIAGRAPRTAASPLAAPRRIAARVSAPIASN